MLFRLLLLLLLFFGAKSGRPEGVERYGVDGLARFSFHYLFFGDFNIIYGLETTCVETQLLDDPHSFVN